jgi:hypothetical protein
MRSKIILVNGGIVLVLCLVAFFLLRATLDESIADPNEQRAELERSLSGTTARFHLDALVVERWLARAARSEKIRSVFEAGTAVARSESATAQATALREEAEASVDLAGISPSLVLFVDADGVGVGRNGSELMWGSGSKGSS